MCDGHKFLELGTPSLGASMLSSDLSAGDSTVAGYSESALHEVLKDPELIACLTQIREKVAAISAEAPRIIPEFTDHTCAHMDHLCKLASVAMTKNEIQELTEAEAFLLLASFYVHDLGMTAPLLPDVRKKLSGISGVEDGEWESEEQFLQAIRNHHGDLCPRLVEQPLFSSGEYLIESEKIRAHFAEHLGQVSASHTWSIARLDEEFGKLGRVSYSDYGTADLGYIACLLRVIDYMDFTATRAPHVVFKVRNNFSGESTSHWLAQMSIADPIRTESGYLKYNTTARVPSMNSWWLAWDILSGLASEIRGVSRYLADRESTESGRFSLQGVVGTDAPDALAHFVRPTLGALPVDVRVTANSMEKVIGLLGGSALYGRDHFAPVREILQNARDAIFARSAIDPDFSLSNGLISVCVGNDCISFGDNGVGMNLSVIKDHLLGLGASYWRSTAANAEYKGKLTRQAGRFGVGFVSAFMLADSVYVDTRKIDEHRYKLSLQGLDRRGEIAKEGPAGPVGTKVSLQGVVASLSDLASAESDFEAMIRARAPMLPFPIEIRFDKGASSQIEVGWWLAARSDDLFAFTKRWHWHAAGMPGAKYPSDSDPYSSGPVCEWPRDIPVAKNDSGFLFFDPRRGEVVLCSHGLAVQSVDAGPIHGMLDIGEQEINIARDQFLRSGPRDSRSFLEWASEVLPRECSLVKDLERAVIAALNDLINVGMVTKYHAVLQVVLDTFGSEAINATSLSWIPVLSPPGSLQYVCLRDFRELICKASTLYFVMGVLGPSQAYRMCTRMSGFDPASSIVIPMESSTVGFSYQIRDRMRLDHGTLLCGSVEEVEGKLRVYRSGKFAIRNEALLAGHLLGSILKNCEVDDQQWANMEIAVDLDSYQDARPIVVRVK